MNLLPPHRRSPSPAWYAIWRRRRDWLRYTRGATVRGVLDIWVPWAMREDAETQRLAAATAREQLRARFPHAVIGLVAAAPQHDERTHLASSRFTFTARRVLRLVRRTE